MKATFRRISAIPTAVLLAFGVIGGLVLAPQVGAVTPVTSVTAINALGQSGAPGSDGWAFTEDDAPGALEISSAINDPVNNDGALYLATPTNPAHVVAQVAASGAPNTLSGVSYQTYLEQTAGAASISLQMGVFCDAGAQTGFNTFVFEPYLNSGIQPVVTGQWQTWSNLTTNGNWWTTHTFAGGGGQSDTESFSSLMTKYMAACPSAGIVDFGVGMGSSNAGTAGWTDNIQYTTSAGSENWNFKALPTTTPVTNVTAINPLGQTGAPGSNGWAFTEDDAPGVLQLSAAANDPVHNDGSLLLATPTSPAHVVAQVAASGTPWSLSNVSYQTELEQTGGAASISIQVGAFCDATADTGFTTFVFEPYLNPDQHSINSNQWQTWGDATSGMWWSTHTFTGGGGQADVEPFASLMAKYMSACPNAGIVDIGLGMGSANPDTAGWADNLQYTTSAGSENWNFQATPTFIPVTTVSAINPLGQTGAPGSNGWAFTEDDAPGVLELSSTVNDPVHNDGSLFLSTPTSPAHVVAQVAASGAPSSLNNVSYQIFLGSTGGAASISLQVGAFCDATADTGFTTFVFEPYLNPAMQAVTTGQWQTWGDATSGMWWSTHTFSGGGGQSDVEPFPSLMAKYMAACPNAGLVDIGVGMGSNNPGTSGYTDNLMYTTSAGSENWDFKVGTVPGAPTIGTATAGNASATVAFTPPTDNGGTPITNDTVTATDLTNSANGGQTATGSSSPITVNGLTNGDTYTFAVTATNSTGTGAASAASNAVVPATVPNAPAIGTATAGNASATVTFTPPAVNGGAAITSYTVTATDTTTPAHGGQTQSGTSSPITVSGLTNGDSYTFTVTATNGIGTGPPSAASNAVTVTSPAPTPSTSTLGGLGYWLVASDGGIFSFGNAQFYGSTGSLVLNKPIIGMIPSFNREGYLLVASDGGVFAFGNAQFFGSAANEASGPIVGLATTPDGSGYWMAGQNGQIYAFGDAPNLGPNAPTFFGSPVVGIAAADKGGYWLALANGTVVPEGDAPSLGSFTGHLNKPIVSIAATPSGKGYWLMGGDGGIFTFGDAQYEGSTGSLVLNKPVLGLAPTPSGKGYWLVAGDGGIFSFGDAQFWGSTGSLRLNKPVVGMAST